MAVNLMTIVTQFLTPDMVAKIAAALGLDRNIVQKMIGGAVPTLLASITDAASSPAGTRQLANTFAQQPAGSLDSLFGGLTEGMGQNTLASTGMSMLTGLFGGSTLETMSQALGEFAGVSKGSSKSLLSMLGPVVLGALGHYARSAGLDAGGLASLLTAQKQQITAAIPSGLANRLQTSGLIDTAEQTAVRGSQTAYAGPRGAVAQWPYWLLGVVVVAGLAWYAMRPTTENLAEAPRPSASQPAASTVGVAPANVNVGDLTKRFNSSVDSLKAVLPNMTDAATAQSALPQLQETTAQLNDIGNQATKLTPESRKTLVQLIVVAMPTINGMCDKALAVPGVGAVAKPAIDELRNKLDALSKV